CQQGNSSPPTF
nr:immunoglobulin light chain junction region [Macaca mulatta]